MDDIAICDECRRPCNKECHVGALSEFEQMRILGNQNSGAGYALFYEIVRRVERARELHPDFAEGQYEALGKITAEVGELVRAVDKGEGEDREIDEAFDSVAVLIRFILGEHKMGRRA